MNKDSNTAAVQVFIPSSALSDLLKPRVTQHKLFTVPKLPIPHNKPLSAKTAEKKWTGSCDQNSRGCNDGVCVGILNNCIILRETFSAVTLPTLGWKATCLVPRLQTLHVENNVTTLPLDKEGDNNENIQTLSLPNCCGHHCDLQQRVGIRARIRSPIKLHRV